MGLVVLGYGTRMFVPVCRGHGRKYRALKKGMAGHTVSLKVKVRK
jgi:hypothetical protein